jgi:hypothetical protein
MKRTLLTNTKPNFLIKFTNGGDSSGAIVGGYLKGQFVGSYFDLSIFLNHLVTEKFDHVCLLSEHGNSKSVFAVYPLTSIFNYVLLKTEETKA